MAVDLVTMMIHGITRTVPQAHLYASTGVSANRQVAGGTGFVLRTMPVGYDIDVASEAGSTGFAWLVRHQAAATEKESGLIQ